MTNSYGSFYLLLALFMLACSNQNNDFEDNPNESLEVTASIFSNRNEAKTQRSPLLLSKDFGQSWIDASYNLPPDIQVSFLEAKGNEIVLASDNKGLFLSSKNKTHWSSIGASLPNEKIIALHLSDETIYVGVYRAGIFQSTDEGVSWQALSDNLPNQNIQAILSFEHTLFVGTDVGIFRRSSDEESWQSVFSNAQVLSIYAFDGKLVAGTSQGTLISRDKGGTWEWIHKEGAVHYTHNVGKRIIELHLTGDLYFSDDWGENWFEQFYQPRNRSYIYEIVEVGNYLVMSNNYGIHRSPNKGFSWELIYPTEAMGFFDFLVVGDTIYGGTREWDEYRKRK